MSSLVDRLPTRFPVGTRYVIEGRPAATALSASICDISNFPTAVRWNCRAMPRSGRVPGAAARVAAGPRENNFVARNRPLPCRVG